MADVTIPSLTSFTNLNDTDMLVVEQVSSGTGKTTYSNLKSKLKTALVGTGDITTGPSGAGVSTVSDAVKVLNDIVAHNDALIHNAIGRGENIGTSVSSAQWASIKDGSFKNMYIGDYWLINNYHWRIAAFDYYYGRNGVTAHHVVIVPDEVSASAVQYHDNVDISGVGYAGSTIHNTTLPSYKSSVVDGAFGASHILSHTVALSNAISDGIVTGHIASDNCTMLLMTAENVFGASVETSLDGSGATSGGGVLNDDSVQFPLFRLYPAAINSSRRYWLRDVCSIAGTSNFRVAMVATSGIVIRRNADATGNCYVRPSFCIFST